MSDEHWPDPVDGSLSIRFRHDMEGDLIASWTGNLTAMLHHLPCNDTFLHGCAEECGLASSGFDHMCTAEKGSFASSMTLLCAPCDYSNCDVNVSLVLSGLESVEGVFLSRLPRFECNETDFPDQVSNFLYFVSLFRRFLAIIIISCYYSTDIGVHGDYGERDYGGSDYLLLAQGEGLESGWEQRATSRLELSLRCCIYRGGWPGEHTRLSRCGAR